MAAQLTAGGAPGQPEMAGIAVGEPLEEQAVGIPDGPPTPNTVPAL